MKATVGYFRLTAAPRSIVALFALAWVALAAQPAPAQTYGFATLQPGTLNHTTASAAAKVLKEKAGLNVLVQPTAGDQVIVPMVAQGEAEIGISNAMEVHDGLSKGFKDLRIITAAHALRVGFFVRKDSGIRTVADLKGKRVPYGFSAMRALEPTVRAILATANLTEKDIRPVLVPNVIRSADDFLAGAADAFYFAFGAPKVREADVTAGGIRMTEIDAQGMPAARKIERWGYLTEVNPGPVFVGVEKPMKIYSFDNLLFTSAKTSDEFVYKVVDTLLKNQNDLIAVQPVLREFSAAFGYKQYEVPYHPGAVKYFKEHNLAPKALD
jgi:TRAP transporter TAXI family solute receptor